MPGPQPTTTISGDAVILNLDYIQIGEGSGNIGIPFVADDGTVKYDSDVVFAVTSDVTTGDIISDLQKMILVLLGDVWGCVAAPTAPVVETFGGAVFESGSYPLGQAGFA